MIRYLNGEIKDRDGLAAALAIKRSLSAWVWTVQ